MIDFSEINNKDGFYITVNLAGVSAQTAGNYGVFFTAYKSCEISAVYETHSVAGSSTPTLQIEKLLSGVAMGSGDTLLSSAYALSSTANIPILKRGIDLTNKRGLAYGDRLALKVSGTLTSLEGLQVTLYLKPRGKGQYD